MVMAAIMDESKITRKTTSSREWDGVVISGSGDGITQLKEEEKQKEGWLGLLEGEDDWMSAEGEEQ